MDKMIIPDEVITSKIYFIRNTKVMLDKDLSELYDVEPRALRQQVKRNIEKFPDHFMFRLTDEEVDLLIAQNVIFSRQYLGGSLPYVFTEHGILQLSNVVKSERATKMSIKIIEVFVSLRDFLAENLNLKLEIELIKKKLSNHDKNIELVFSYLDEMMEKQENKVERIKIGYKK